MKQENLLALFAVMLISGCQHADDKRLSSHLPASNPASAGGAIEIPAFASGAVPQGEVQTFTVPTESLRVETKEEKRFVEHPCCPTTHSLVRTRRAAAVPLIVTTLDRLSGETNAPTRCDIIRGALWDPEVCTNTQFHAIIQRGTNDPSEAVRLKTSLMVSNALVRFNSSARKQNEPEPNHRAALDAAMSTTLHIARHWRRASEHGRCLH